MMVRTIEQYSSSAVLEEFNAIVGSPVSIHPRRWAIQRVHRIHGGLPARLELGSLMQMNCQRTRPENARTLVVPRF